MFPSDRAMRNAEYGMRCGRMWWEGEREGRMLCQVDSGKEVFSLEYDDSIPVMSGFTVLVDP